MGGQISKVSSAIVDCGKEFGTALTTQPGPDGFYRKTSIMTPRQGMPGITYFTGEHPLKSAVDKQHFNTNVRPAAAPQPRIDKQVVTDAQ